MSIGRGDLLSWIGESWHRLPLLFGRDALERGLDEELHFHIDQQTERNIRQGHDARRGAAAGAHPIRRGGAHQGVHPRRIPNAVARRFCSRSAIWREVAPAHAGIHRGRHADARLGHWRQHRDLQRREYGASGTACRTASRIELPSSGSGISAIGKDRDLVAPPNYLDWKTQNSVFDALGAYRVNGFALTGAGEPESLTAITLSASLFRALGVDAARRPDLQRGGRERAAIAL